MKSMLQIFALFILTQFVYSLNIDQKSITQLENKLGVKIIYNKIVADTWQKSLYEIPTNEKLLNNYLKLLDQEYSKYPKGYFKKARAGNLILVEKYSFNGNHQAAMPDPYGDRLYLAIDGAYGVHTDLYLVHVMHHELQHCAEYAIFKNQYYKWQEWAALNTPDFKYGQGGLTAYHDKTKDYSTINNPVPGFVNLYSTLGQEEDRAEIFALIMSDLERPKLISICEKDKIVYYKVLKMIELMNQFSGVSDAYWDNPTREKKVISVQTSDREVVDANWSYEDIKTVRTKVFESISQSKRITAHLKKSYCILASNMINDTDEHIDTRSILESIRTKLINEADFTFIDDQALLNTLRQQKLQPSDLYDSIKTARIGKLLSASMILRGRISNIRKIDENTEYNIYQLTFQLVNMMTGTIIWTDQVEIGKKMTKKKFR